MPLLQGKGEPAKTFVIKKVFLLSLGAKFGWVKPGEIKHEKT